MESRVTNKLADFQLATGTDGMPGIFFFFFFLPSSPTHVSQGVARVREPRHRSVHGFASQACSLMCCHEEVSGTALSRVTYEGLIVPAQWRSKHSLDSRGCGDFQVQVNCAITPMSRSTKVPTRPTVPTQWRSMTSCRSSKCHVPYCLGWLELSFAAQKQEVLQMH